MQIQNSHSTPRTINVAVVGLGFMGVTHIKSYAQIPSARLAAVCDAVRPPVNGVIGGVSGNVHASDAIKLADDVKIYSDLADVLADSEIDLVDLCVPTPLHHPQTIASLNAGKHVICEKPLARTSALAREIIAAAKTSKGFLMPAMCLRFWPEWSWIKRAIDENSYGKVLAARFRRVSEPPGWSRESYFKGDESGGALLDLHIHDTDFIQYCFGRPRSVYSNGLSQFSGAIDHVVTLYQVANGATVHAEGTWLMSAGHGFKMNCTVNFERATVDFDLQRGEEALVVFEDGKPRQVIRSDEPDGYVGELRHFIESIQSGRPPSIVTPEDGLSAVEICEAEERSIKTGQPVMLQPLE